MKVQTYLFGEIEVNPDQVITFPNGVVGLEDSKRFMLAHESSQSDPASFTLQSLDDPHVAFQIVDPASVGFHYELALTEEEMTLLQNPAPGDVSVMLVLYKQESENGGVAANIRAPIIINTQTRVGLQKVLPRMRSNITISNLVSSV